VKFEINVHVYHHDHTHDQILNLLRALVAQGETMANELADLTARVATNNEVIESALVLIQGLHDAIIAAGTDPVKLKALTDSLVAEDDKLAAAIVANTPAAPAP
jgi:esterase/lipase